MIGTDVLRASKSAIRQAVRQLAPKPAAHSPSAVPNGLETCAWTKAEVRLAWRIANSEVCRLSVSVISSEA